jgi:hypothetical protein
MALVVLREKILEPILAGTVSRRDGQPPENRDPEEILQELNVAA